MYRKIMKITVFVLVLCTSLVGFAQKEIAVGDSVNAKHQDFKSCFESFDKKFKLKFKGELIPKSYFKQIANQTQFLIEKKKTAKLLGTKKGSYSLAKIYNKLVEMSKKKKLDIGLDYIPNDNPLLLRARNKQYYTYKTTAALIVEASANEQTSNTRNELTLIWMVETDNQKEKIKSIQLTSLKAKPVSGFFEYENQQIQQVAKNLIEKYYQNLLSRSWKAVLAPEILNKKEIEDYLKNSTQIGSSGNVRVPLFNSQTIMVNEGNVPSLIIYAAEKEQTFGLTFNIKVNDSLTDGEITKVVYRRLETFEEPTFVPEPEPESEPVPEPKPEPQKKVQQPEIEERGITYKVQILALYDPIKLADLPKEYRNVENVSMEESIIGDKKYYQYVIPVGSDPKEAQTLKNKLVTQGIKSAWVVKYKDGKRFYPNKTK